MKFVKMHGLGNDFVFFGGEDAQRVEENGPAALAQKLCQKHFGVCADGLVLILPSASCDARMRIFNPDGSEAEMCGNALRCVGKYLYETGAVQSDCMSVETLGGIKPLRVSAQNGRVTSVAADMGEAKLGETVKIDLGGRETSFLTVDMGNPHAVTYDLFPGDVEFEHFGPCVERHSHFPNRTNVEFCRAQTPTRADVRVWERGAGPTLACGTGASAAFAAGVHLGLLREKAEVLLPGGRLLFKFGKNGHVIVSGPAEISFFRGTAGGVIVSQDIDKAAERQNAGRAQPASEPCKSMADWDLFIAAGAGAVDTRDYAATPADTMKLRIQGRGCCMKKLPTGLAGAVPGTLRAAGDTAPCGAVLHCDPQGWMRMRSRAARTLGQPREGQLGRPRL